jgi:hypothetical protein
MKLVLKVSLLILLMLTACGRSQVERRDTNRGGLEEILSTTQPKQVNLEYLKKIDGNLQNLVVDYLSGKDSAQSARARGIKINDKREVMVDIYTNDSPTLASMQLTKLGMTVLDTNESLHIVEGALPIDLVLPSAQLDIVKAIIPVMGSGTDQINP